MSSESVKKILRFHPIKSGVSSGDPVILSPLITEITAKLSPVRPAWCRRGKNRRKQDELPQGNHSRNHCGT
jgi:hypothetical protein